MAADYKTKILLHKPYENSAGQYNYGRIENEDKHILGIPEDTNYGGEEIELYSVVEHAQSTWQANPQGKIWLYKGSEFKIDRMYMYGAGVETDKYQYDNRYQSVFFFDSDKSGVIDDGASGTEIRNWIGGDVWMNHRTLAHSGTSRFTFSSSCAEATGFLGLARTGDFCNYGLHNNSYWPELNRILYDLPYEGHSKTNSEWSIDNVFDMDENRWTQALSGNIDESWYYIVTRISGDEREYSPVGHGWLELTGGYNKDELPRNYSVYAIHKQLLFDVFVGNQSKTICFMDENNNNDYVASDGANQGNDGFIGWDYPGCDVMVKTESPTHYYNPDGSRLQYAGQNWNISNSKKFRNKNDDHSGIGHGWPHGDGNQSAYRTYGAVFTFTAPEWSPERALEAGYKWTTDKTFGQLNPKYDTDFTGFPSVFYQTDGKFWDSNLIKDFRPLSRVTSVIDTFGDKTDLQNYYTSGTEYAFNSSAPLTVNLKFDYVQNVDNFNPKPFPAGQAPEDNNYDIHYGWFVVNWNWDSTWEGGETLEEIASRDFPTTEAQTIRKQFNTNTYKLKDQTDTGFDDIEIGWGFDVNKNEAVHTYNTPGVKVIKVVHMTYIYSHHDGQDLEGEPYAGNYIQALQWKLSTIKINLNSDASFVNDFSDVGGADYTYLPYPEVLQYDYPEGEIEFDEDTEKQIWCEDGLNAPIDVITSENKLCKFKTSSHPVISGLSKESVYVQSLKGLLSTDRWDSSEGNDKMLAEKSYDNTPNQSLDEYGDYLGKSDIGTVRYFNKPYPIQEMLGLSLTTQPYNTTSYNYENGSDGNWILWHNYNNTEYWDGVINKFPIESAATSIFISEYPLLHDKCLSEITFDSFDGVTVRDTSGNGSKGIVFGDFSIKKESKGQPTQRDSSIDTPKIANDNKKAY